MEVVASHVEVRQIMEIITKRTKDRISAQSLEEVLEQEQCAKALTQAVKEKMSQLSASTQVD